MKTVLLLLLISFNLYSTGQTDYSEIANKDIQRRVLLIKSRTDSFVRKMTNNNVFRRLVPHYGVTYLDGEFGKSYLFLNQYKTLPEDIYNLTQFYSINDKTLGVSDTIGIYYLEISNQFAPETYSLELGFRSNDDYLKVKALNYLYLPATQKKLKDIISAQQLKAPSIKITVDGKSNTYFVLIKGENKPHNFAL
jgi:hypothetical protein